MWRKARTGALSVEDVTILVAAFVADWRDPDGRLLPVGLRGPLLEQAASSAALHGLRAYDAVQLSCALAARAADPTVDSFLCFDAELREAAGREGFTLVA